jgi:hypothetical protein
MRNYLLLDLRCELTTTPALAEGGDPSICDTRLLLRVLVISDSASRLPRVPRTEINISQFTGSKSICYNLHLRTEIDTCIASYWIYTQTSCSRASPGNQQFEILTLYSNIQWLKSTHHNLMTLYSNTTQNPLSKLGISGKFLNLQI